MYYTDPSVYEFISRETSDPIVERKICRVSGTKFPIFQSDLEFYDKISPKFPHTGNSSTSSPLIRGDGEGFVKYQIPTPTLCPEERQRRRLMFRNERKLYKRRCDATGENIISIYSPDKPFKVYNQKYRRSDERNPMDYGRDFDFNRTFTEQFGELQYRVPKESIMNKGSQNSDYTNLAIHNKDCYLVSGGDYNQDCLYSSFIFESEKLVDSHRTFSSENAYELLDCEGCSACYYCVNTNNSRKCRYCHDCEQCEYCVGCVGLQKKKYCIFNKQYDKETFEKYFEAISWGDVQHKIGNFLHQQVKPATKQHQTENCIGNRIDESQNCILSFDTMQSQDCRNIFLAVKATDVRDTEYVGHESSGVYNSCSITGSYHCLFSNFCLDQNADLLYCMHTYNSQHCFGCIGLRNKQYCIFNKQYTKEEYNELVPKIIGHMMSSPLEGGQGGSERGEFFDPSLSPFGYNETVAQEYFPCKMSEDGTQIISEDGSVSFMRDLGNSDEKSFDIIGKNHLQSFKIKRQEKNYDPQIPPNADVLKGDQIPSDISLVKDDILQKIFVCEVSGRPFRIIKQELDFYRKHNLPLPRKHPDVRHEERLAQRPPRELHLRHCDKCGKEMVSVYRNIEGSNPAAVRGKDGNTSVGVDSIDPKQIDPKKNIGKVYCEKCYQTEIYG